MIGVIGTEQDLEVLGEFFELFKTPWERYEQGNQYDVLIINGETEWPHTPVELLIHYSSVRAQADTHGRTQKEAVLLYKGRRIPLYGECLAFPETQSTFLTVEKADGAVGCKNVVDGKTRCRIGYDLVREIRILLTTGQPVEHAISPTLELHIAILRDLLVESGVPLVEIPPIPVGYTFIACLTHDIDHPSIRLLPWDHTLLGFVYRAIIRSFIQVLKGRMSFRHLVSNYLAVAKLPLVRLGYARDFWYDFDRYQQLEEGAQSTYFALPFKHNPGLTANGIAPRIRASSYGAADIADRLQALVASGQEVGLHGIDAWIDSAKGQTERQQIGAVTGATDIGVRMHWLYFNEHSPVTLEKAGFSYDSTIGYNQTIGYRAGTCQVYKPLEANHLLELPLHVMDTALFYPIHLNLTPHEAERRVRDLFDDACHSGGVITFNWHDRSRAPERLWGEFYGSQIREVKQRGAWCATACQTVSWFRSRRSIVFERSGQNGKAVRIRGAHPVSESIPGLRVRVYNRKTASREAVLRYVESTVVDSLTVGEG